jgi:hypothetical protein
MSAYNRSIIINRCENFVLKTFLHVLTKANCTHNNFAQLTIFDIVNRCHALLTVAMNCHSEGVI